MGLTFEFQKIIADAKFAIDHIDDVMAHKLLKEIDGFLSQSQSKIDPQLLSRLNDLKLKLSIVNFPNLSEDAAANILRNHYLESYSIGISMENRLTAMLFFYPEIPRDSLRKKLKAALVQNQQKLGQLTISQWIQEFEKMFPVETRDLSASVRFSIGHPQSRSLSSADREKLKELLHAYDYLLVTTLPATGPVLEQIIEIGEKIGKKGGFMEMPKTYTVSDYSPSIIDSGSSNFQEKKMVDFLSISLTEALRQFPNLGEQLITSAPLKLRIFPDRVKPSIKNWIADYHDALGRGKHEMMERGNFLFHGENTKRLTSLERRRLAEILKSLDDGSNLSVDEKNQKVIFETNSQADKTAAIPQETRPAYKAPETPITKSPISDLDKRTENYFKKDFPVSGVRDEKVQMKTSNSFQDPINNNPFVAKSQDYYEIPKTQPLKPMTQNLESKTNNLNSWNPAENVKKRMAGEDKNFGSSRIRYQEDKTPQESSGSLRFSSPQRLPVEKKQEAPKSFIPKKVSPSFQPAPKPQVKQIIPEKPATSPQAQTDDDLMAKIRELKKQPNQPKKQGVVYKITPIGFVEKKENKLEFQSDNQGPKISGNTVDLS